MATAGREERPKLDRTTLERLMALQLLDEDIARQAATIERAPKEIAQKEAELATARRAAAAAKQKVTDTQRAIDQRSGDSKQLQVEAQKLEGQLYTLKNNEEFKAMKAQIADRQERDRKAQDETLALMIALDDLKARQKAVEEVVKTYEAEFKKTEERLAGARREAEKRLVEEKSRRQEAAATIAPAAFRLYEIAVERSGGTGLARLRGENCSGCDTVIRAQLLSEIAAGFMILCPHCDRILHA